MKTWLIALTIFSIIIISIAGCAQSATPDNVESSGNNTSVPANTATGGQLAADNETPPPATYQPVEQQPPAPVKISDVIGKAEDYLGKDIIIEGKIVNECSAGCWFNLQDGTGVIYVDLAPNNMVIPQKVGSRAKVHGVVAERAGVAYIIGNKVEF